MSKATDGAAFLAMASFWALNYPLVKFIYQYQSPMAILFFRLFLAAIFSSLLFWKHIRIPRDLKTHFFLAIFGILNLVFFMGFWFTGESTENPGISSILVYTYPVISIAFSAIFLKEKLSLLRVVGTMLGFFGMVLIFVDQLSIKSTPGLFFLIAAATSWAFGTIVFKKYLLNVGNYTVNSMQYIYAVPIVFLYVISTGGFNPTGFSMQFFAVVLYMGLLSTSVAYYIYLHLYSKYSVSSISAYFFAVPAFSIVFSYFIRGEVNTIYTYVGFAFISLGIYMSSKQITRRKNSSSDQLNNTNK